MFKRHKNNRGIALILVISSVLFLTTIVFDYFKEAQMGHQLAVNYRNRIQGYYLAKSAVNFSKLVIFFNKKVESMLAKYKMTAADVGYQPLYKQIPINSEGIRGMLQAAAAPTVPEGGEGEGEGEGEGDSDGAGMGESSFKQVNMLSQKDIEEFLNFEGNFDAEITEEMSKYSLNAVSKMLPTSTGYDLHKKVLLSILRRGDFKNFFENQDYDSINLVHAISDFVDVNDVINEFDKVERGSEEGIYKDVDYKVKSAPFLTQSELRLVEGMSDDIYELIKPLTTVYHTSEKINICLADHAIVDSLIVHFTNFSECTPPLDPEDDLEEIEKLRDTMLGFCPDTNGLANAFNTELNLPTTPTNTTNNQANNPNNNVGITTGNNSAANDSGCKLKIENMITNANTIFRIVAVGDVNGVKSKITTVIDASNTNAKDWKVLYYQVD